MRPRHRAVTPRSAYVGGADTAAAPDSSVGGSSAEGNSAVDNSAAGSSVEGNSGEGNSVADAPEGPAVAAEARTCPQNRRRQLSRGCVVRRRLGFAYSGF